MDKKKIILTTMLAVVAINSTVKAQQAGSIQLADKTSVLQEILDNTVDNKKVFGVSFSVKHKGEVWSGSAGDMENEQPFFIASTTKLFTTAIILHLVSENKLTLEDKIGRYLDDDVMQGLHLYKGVDYSNEITVRNLLAHTSGLPDYFEDKGTNGKSLEEDLFSGNDQFWTFEQAIERSKKIHPLFAPSTKNKAHYSDANFQLLGRIIENITGKSYSENCRELIFEPLNLSKTYLYNDINDIRPKAMYYKNNVLKIPKAMTSFGADGGIVSTSQELLMFVEAFFTGKLFPKSYIEELQVWNPIFPPIKSGVGIHQFKLPAILGMPELIGHSGLSGALAYYDPKNDLYIAGTVNQISYPSTSFTVATKLIQATVSKRKEQKIKSFSAIGIGATYSSIEDNAGKPKAGLSLGLYKEYNIFKPVSFTAEILYNQKGERSNDPLQNIRLHYIDFPLMLKLNLWNDKIGIASGLSTNVLLGSNKAKNTFQRVEYSVPFAVNYVLTDFLQVSLRYNMGISNIAKNDYPDQRLKNNWFGISLMIIKP